MEVTAFKVKNITDENLLIDVVTDMSLFLTEDQLDKFGGEDSLDGQYEFLFTFLEEFETEKLKNIFIKHNIFVSSQNITHQVLMGTANNNVIFKNGFVKGSNEELGLIEFLEENLTIDMVLDKMNNNYILTEIDKKVLRNA